MEQSFINRLKAPVRWPWGGKRREEKPCKRCGHPRRQHHHNPVVLRWFWCNEPGCGCKKYEGKP